MELMERTRRVSTSENLAVSNFSIKASAKAFAILSSGLYSDKIKAIIRELSTNAHDAQVVAKVDRPFDVFLPTYNDSRFYIRDYGTGISPDNIFNIYTKYFESDKTDSNELTGCLGLGSKSPFAYTDSFTVTSYYNGKQYTYSAFISANGYPSITLMGEQDTNEPNGLKVEFLVKSQDRSNFIAKAKDVYSWFVKAPKFVGEMIVVDKHNPVPGLPSEQDWRFVEGIRRATAIMGNVAYPISINDVSLSLNQQKLLSSNLCIDFNIGDVDIEASREGLSYDPRTLNTIKSKLNHIIKVIEKSVETNIKNTKNLWEASINLESYRAQFSTILDLNNVMYHGKVIPNSFTCPKFNRDDKKPDCTDFTWIRFTKKSSWNDKIERWNEIERISPSRKVHFFLSDIKRGSIERVKNHVKTLPYGEQVILVIPGDGSKYIDSFFESLGGYDKTKVINTSTLPAPVRAAAGPRVKGIKDSITLFQYTGTASTSWAECDDDDFDDDSIYIPISNYKALSEDGTTDWKDVHALRELLEYYKMFTGKELKLYGIRKAKVKEVLEDCDATYLAEHIKSVFTKERSSVALTINASHSFMNELNQCTYEDFVKFVRREKLPQKYQNAADALDNLKKKYYNGNTYGLQTAYQRMQDIATGTRSSIVEPKELSIVTTEVNFVKTLIEGLITPVFRNILNAVGGTAPARVEDKRLVQDFVVNYINKNN